MDFGIHPTVEAVHEAVRAKGGSLSCPLCGRDEFALEEVTVLGAGVRDPPRAAWPAGVRELRVRGVHRPGAARGWRGRGRCGWTGGLTRQPTRCTRVGVIRGSGLFASERGRAQRTRSVTDPAVLVSNMSKEQAKKGRDK